MILILIAETAYIIGMGSAVSTVPGRMENLFLNPASTGNKGIYITFYNPYNIEDYYHCELYSGLSLWNFQITTGIKITSVNKEYQRIIGGIGIKRGFLGFSCGTTFERSPFGTRSEEKFFNMGINIFLQPISLGISRDRIGFGYITDKGKITLETEDFHQIYAGAEFVVNRVISGSVGWMNGKPTMGIYLKNPSFEIEMGFSTNPDLGQTTLFSVRWKI